MNAAPIAPAVTETTGWAYRVSGPACFERVEDKVPTTLLPGQIKVLLTAGAVCGSDLPVARGAMSPAGGPGQPGRPLHEVVGRVLASEDPDIEPGDTVVGWALHEDALREIFITTGARVSKVRMPVDDAHATVAQSIACLMTVFERLGPLEGRSVGIVGVGPFGMMASALARSRGAGRISGVDQIDRRADAMALPFDDVAFAHSRTWAAGLEEAERPDVVLEMVGHQTGTLVDAMHAVAPGGTVVSFGVPDDDWYSLPLRDFFRRNGTLITGVTTQHRAMLELAQDWLNDHPWLAEYIVTDIYPMDRVQDAFRAALEPKKGQRKVILDVEGAR